MTFSTITIVEGKSATIVSPTQLAINVGDHHGVQIGDTAIVRKSVEVKDPDSNARLGVVHLTRLRLRVTMVGDSFSVATVTEEAASNTFATMLDATRIRRLKTIVAYESEANDNAVRVTPGESVLITRRVDDGNDEDDE